MVIDSRENEGEKKKKSRHTFLTDDQSGYFVTNFPSQFIGCSIREGKNREHVYIYTHIAANQY